MTDSTDMTDSTENATPPEKLKFFYMYIYMCTYTEIHHIEKLKFFTNSTWTKILIWMYTSRHRDNSMSAGTHSNWDFGWSRIFEEFDMEFEFLCTSRHLETPTNSIWFLDEVGFGFVAIEVESVI